MSQKRGSKGGVPAAAQEERSPYKTHEILGAILGTDDSLEECAKRAMNRIKSLEAALIETECKRIYGNHVITWEEFIEDPDPDAQNLVDDIRKAAREKLHSDGLIDGGDQHVEPAKLMLTAEQRDALGEAISMIEDPCEDRYQGEDRVLAILQNMLSGYLVAWEATPDTGREKMPSENMMRMCFGPC